MPLLREGREAEDVWTRLPSDHEALTGDGPWPTGPVLVPAEAAGAARAAGVRFGVYAAAEDAAKDPEALADAAQGAGLVCVGFAKFADGRGFSVARALRKAGWDGMLRATGPLIPDQALFAEQCGFDEIEVPDDLLLRAPAETWAAARARAVARYQAGHGAPNGPRSILAARHGLE
jgi:uncharacterized protein (DUF934 family)